MGQFSWIYSDTNKQVIDNKRADTYLLVPKPFQEKYGKVIYEDTYDIGHEYAVHSIGIPDWLDNDRYVNFEKIGEDEIEFADAWFKLPSGKYAHLS